MRLDRPWAVVRVRDDGGRPDASGGTGLRGLADRVSALGGALEIDSSPDRGTAMRPAWRSA